MVERGDCQGHITKSGFDCHQWDFYVKLERMKWGREGTEKQSRLLNNVISLYFGCIPHYPRPLCYAGVQIAAKLSCRKCSTQEKEMKGNS